LRRANSRNSYAVPSASLGVGFGRGLGAPRRHLRCVRFSAEPLRQTVEIGLREQAGQHNCKRLLCGMLNFPLPGGGHPHMKRREFSTLLGGAIVPVILITAWVVVWPGWLRAAQAQSWVSEEGGSVRHIVVTLNKSRTPRFDKPFASAVVGA